jgi:hypothetical protein
MTQKEPMIDAPGSGHAKDESTVQGDEHARAPGHFPLLTDSVTASSASLFEENLRRGEKPAEAWMCGIEFELFGYDARRDMARLNPAQVQRAPSSKRTPGR